MSMSTFSLVDTLCFVINGYIDLMHPVRSKLQIFLSRDTCCRTSCPRDSSSYEAVMGTRKRMLFAILNMYLFIKQLIMFIKMPSVSSSPAISA